MNNLTNDIAKIVTNTSLKKFQIGKATILMPSDHALPGYQTTFPLYDRFLPFLAANIDGADWMIDVGANVGDTLFAILNQKPNSRILALEADRDFSELMKINLANNQHLFPSAQIDTLSCLVGTGKFKGSLSGQSGTKALVVSNNSDSIDDKVLSLDEIIKSKEIDLERLKILKVDTDGFDFDVILSGKDSIAVQKPIIYFENQIFTEYQRQGYSEMYQMLEKCGYTQFYLFDNFGALILKTNSIEAIESINEYLDLQYNQIATRTFYYCDILCATEADITTCDLSIAAYQNWIENHRGSTNAALPSLGEVNVSPIKNQKTAPVFILDGVFFQLYSTGIARVWKSLLEEWANTEFGNRLVVLDRAGTAPKVEGIIYHQIPAYDYSNTDADRAMLQQVCDELDADLFISTYYTTPLETPSVFMGYDMIPEVLGADLNQPMWLEKRHAIEHASAYLAISEHTAKDLVEIYSNIDPNQVTVAHCGVQSVFKQASSTNLAEFRYRYGITKPYFVMGASGGYKNTQLFLKAFNRLPTKSGFDIIVTGGHLLSEEDRQYTFGSNVHYLRLDDFELSLAYAGAIALVYPSKYEGFGLPIVEAFASGCPVITCPNASIPEVAGDAAIYVFDDDIDGMAEALCEVQKPQVRAALITAGLARVKQFSWDKMGSIVKSVLIEQTLTHLQLSEDNLIIFPDWSRDEEELGEEISNVCYNLAQNSELNRPTLLIDTTNVEDIESVNVLISGIAMNLMLSADIDITEQMEIALTGELAPIQWQVLLPKLRGRVKLKLEDSRSIELSGANLISEIQLSESPVLALV